jgi:hypothetical protein
MSERESSTQMPSLWHQRSRIGLMIGCVLLSSALLVRWMMGNTAVEQSHLYWLQPIGTVLMIIAGFVNLWTHPKDVLGSVPPHVVKDDARP